MSQEKRLSNIPAEDDNKSRLQRTSQHRRTIGSGTIDGDLNAILRRYGRSAI
jgi:hypothetical protein